MFLVIVTSAICCGSGIFTPEERLNQTMVTISSIRKNIPECVIYVGEITVIPNSYKKKLSSVCDKLILCDSTRNTSKSIGETYILRCILENHIPQNTLIVYKISGRYFLTDSFVLDEFKKNKYNFLPAKNCYHTTFYSIPKTKIGNFTNILKNCISSDIGSDIEHNLFNLIPVDEVNNLTKLNCKGFYFDGREYDV